MRCSALEFFELPRSFSQAELRKAFRRKVRLYHPDSSMTPVSSFQELMRAYAILRCPSTRESLGDRRIFLREAFIPSHCLQEGANQLIQNLERLERDELTEVPR